jgi:hypothetical protein
MIGEFASLLETTGTCLSEASWLIAEIEAAKSVTEEHRQQLSVLADDLRAIAALCVLGAPREPKQKTAPARED